MSSKYPQRTDSIQTKTFKIKTSINEIKIQLNNKFNKEKHLKRLCDSFESQAEYWLCNYYHRPCAEENTPLTEAKIVIEHPNKEVSKSVKIEVGKYLKSLQKDPDSVFAPNLGHYDLVFA